MNVLTKIFPVSIGGQEHLCVAAQNVNMTEAPDSSIPGVECNSRICPLMVKAVLH